MASADDTIAKLAAQAAGAQRAAAASEQLGAAVKAEQAAVAGLGGSLDEARARLIALGQATTDAAGRMRDMSGKFISKAQLEAVANGGTLAAASIKKVQAASADGAKSGGLFQSAMGQVASGGKIAADAIKSLGGVVKSLSSGDLPTAKQAMSAVGAMLGGALTSGADKAADALKALGPEGAAAGAALQGLAAVLSATIGLLTQFMGLAIEAAQKADLMRSRFAALAGGAAGGKAVQEMLAKLSATLPFASSQVNEWAQQLLAAGIKGKQLEADIKAIAAATALMGEAGGAAATSFFKRLGEGGPAADKLLKDIQQGGRRSDAMLKEMGLSLADLGGKAAVAKMNAEQLHEAVAKAMAKKGAGPLADMALTLPAILQKAREGFMSLFGGAGPAVKAFMTSVKELFAQFNKGSPIITALKPIMTGLLTTLFGWATRAVTAIRGVVVWLTNSGKAGGMFSGATKVLSAGWAALVVIFGAVKSALAPVISFLAKVFSNAMVLNGIKTIFTVIAGAIVVVVVLFAMLAGVVAGVVGVIVGVIGTLVGALAGVVGEVASFASAIVDGLMSLDFSGFIAKMAGMARAGLNAFKAALGIASPSKVMMEMGGHVAGGLAEGVEDGAPKAQAATAKLVDPKALKAGRGGASAGGGKTVVFDGCTFGTVSETQIREWTLKAMEEDGFAGPEGAPA